MRALTMKFLQYIVNVCKVYNSYKNSQSILIFEFARYIIDKNLCFKLHENQALERANKTRLTDTRFIYVPRKAFHWGQ